MKMKSIKAKIFFGFVFVVLVFSSAFADEKTEKVDKLFSSWDKTSSPGAALAIIKEGKILYERGYGIADLEHNVILTPASVFDIGSCSKQFTAACVALLSQEGKISLDDDIRKYVPEVPFYRKPITVRHLVHHTSGIRDYIELLSLAGYTVEGDCPTIEETIEMLARQKNLNFLPGQEWLYSNSGYFLLSLIVERASGKSLNDFAQEKIFRPLGMTNTHFHDDHTLIVKNRAVGYSPTKDGFRIDMSSWEHTGDGALLTTVEDLALWDQAFYDSKLGKEIIEQLQIPGTLNSGKKLNYAFGLMVGEYKGLKTVGHGGSWAGYRAGMIRFPEQKFSVICLSNLSTINPSSLCWKIADIYLADKLKEEPGKEPKKEVTPLKLSKEELEEKTGNYQDKKTGTWTAVEVKEEKLKVNISGQEFLLSSVSQTRFQALETSFDLILDFAKEEKGKPKQAILTMREEVISLVKAPQLLPLSLAQLGEYLGEYQSAELGVTYIVLIKEGKLFLKYRNSPKDSLKAMAPDKFTLQRMNFDFFRNKKKKIGGFKLSVGRAANIEFIKK